MKLSEALEIYVAMGKGVRNRSERIMQAERILEPLIEILKTNRDGLPLHDYEQADPSPDTANNRENA